VAGDRGPAYVGFFVFWVVLFVGAFFLERLVVELGLCWGFVGAFGSASRSREGLTQNLAKPNSSPFGPR
jgi:hypothetical protein